MLYTVQYIADRRTVVNKQTGQRLDQYIPTKKQAYKIAEHMNNTLKDIIGEPNYLKLDKKLTAYGG